MALSLFGISSSRETARDANRKADLELIRSGLELYKADCNSYPVTTAVTGGSPLVGDPTLSTTCLAANIYIAKVPLDPLNTARVYRYSRLTASKYEICAALENGTGTVTCSGFTNCGDVSCNYKVTNP